MIRIICLVLLIIVCHNYSYEVSYNTKISRMTDRDFFCYFSCGRKGPIGLCLEESEFTLSGIKGEG